MNNYSRSLYGLGGADHQDSGGDDDDDGGGGDEKDSEVTPSY